MTNNPFTVDEIDEIDEVDEVDQVRPVEIDEVDQVGTAKIDVSRAVEAILMIADEPQSIVALATSLLCPVEVVRQAIDDIVADYNGEKRQTGGVRRGFELRETGGGWRIYVRPEYDDVVTGFVSSAAPTKLSHAAMETLAVIAYKQPISRSSVAAIRAVNIDSVVRTLINRGLIAEHSIDSETGAIMYCTTDMFLSQLGINSLDELPPLSPFLPDGTEELQYA